jgi:hypothetical protein
MYAFCSWVGWGGGLGLGLVVQLKYRLFKQEVKSVCERLLEDSLTWGRALRIDIERVGHGRQQANHGQGQVCDLPSAPLYIA